MTGCPAGQGQLKAGILKKLVNLTHSSAKMGTLPSAESLLCFVYSSTFAAAPGPAYFEYFGRHEVFVA